MFCPKCGANVPENQAFCAGCGTRMTPAAPQQNKPAAAKVALNKDAISKDAMIVFRIAIVALALLSIILIFSKGMGIHYDGGDFARICEWDYFFDDVCDESAALAITFQILSVVFIVGAAAAIVLPIFMPQLSRIKYYNLIPGVVAILNLLLYAILLIVALVTFGEAYDTDMMGAHPASASWFYIADMIALIVLSFKMNKASK